MENYIFWQKQSADGDEMGNPSPSAIEFPSLDPSLMATDCLVRRHMAWLLFMPKFAVCGLFRCQIVTNYKCPSLNPQRQAMLRLLSFVANSVTNLNFPSLSCHFPSLIPSWYGFFCSGFRDVIHLVRIRIEPIFHF